MFEKIMLHGGAASILWGYRPAAVLTAWRIWRTTTGWSLSATFSKADRFQCAQAIARKELRFAARRPGGFWCWPVEAIEIAGAEVRATLGQPEQ